MFETASLFLLKGTFLLSPTLQVPKLDSLHPVYFPNRGIMYKTLRIMYKTDENMYKTLNFMPKTHKSMYKPNKSTFKTLKTRQKAQKIYNSGCSSVQNLHQSRIIILRDFISIISCFFNVEKTRLTLSRVVPTTVANS
jgi:hypothetical protein